MHLPRLSLVVCLALFATLAPHAACLAQGGYWKYVGSRLDKCHGDAKTDYCTAAGGRNALKFTVTRTDGDGNAVSDTAMLRWEITGRLDALVPGQTLAMRSTLTQQLNTVPCIGLDARFGWRDPDAGVTLQMAGRVGPERPVDAGGHKNTAEWSFKVPPRGGARRCIEFMVEGSGGHKATMLFDYEWTDGAVPAEKPLPITLPERHPGHTGGRPCLVRILRGSARLQSCGSLARDEISANTTDELVLGEGTEATMYVADRILTTADTRAELIFPDGTRFIIKSNTALVVQNEAVQLENGQGWFNLRKQGREFQVVTPSSVIGVLGTTFAVEVAKGGSTICAVGDGKVWSTDTAKKKKVTIPAGSFSSCKPGGLPTDPKRYDATMKTRFFGEDGEKGTPIEVIAPQGDTGTPPATIEEPLSIQPRPTPTVEPTPAPTVTGDPVTLLDNSNAVGVRNGPTAPTTFTITRPHVVTFVRTYHWNGGKGASPGTLALRGADGTQYGPWQSKGTGSGGRQNIMWVVEPNVLIPAGKYTVVDSAPATWSCNDKSGKAGIAWVNGIPQ